MDTFRGNMLRSYLTSYIYLTTKRHTSCRLSQDTMPPKKVSRAKGTNKEEDSYSYITDEEDEHVAAASSTPAPAAAPPSAVTGSEPPAGPPGVGAAFTRTVQRGPPCATSKAKTRIPSPSTSSDDPGPVLPPRERHNPEPPRAPSRSAERRSPSVRREPTDSHGIMAHGQQRSPARRGKGKHRGHAPRRTQDCPHCWAPIAVTPRGSGLSQHMWWNLECIAHQIYVQGDTTWSQALRQAQAVKDRRESEWDCEEWPDAAPKEPPAPPVLPARSARHRFLLEERRRAEPVEPEPEEGKGSEHDRDAETEKKKKKKKRKTHRGGSDASREVDRSRRRRRPPSSDASDGGATRLSVVHGGDKSDLVWIQVSRASLKAN